MDLEMVFNDLSLRTPADSIQTARQWMLELTNTAREAAELGVRPVIRTPAEFYATALAPSYSLYDWLVDNNVERDIQRFILISAKAPFDADVEDPEIQDRNLESEFYYEGNFAIGLGFAILMEALALSIKSEQKWDSSSLILESTWLESDGNFTSDNVSVVHASRVDHIQEHINWIQKRLKTGVRDGLELWNRKNELFPNLEFCENAGHQIKSLGYGSTMLRPVINRLFELQNYCKNWKSGQFEPDSLPSKASPESQKTLEQFGEERTFLCLDNRYRVFSWHVRLTPGAWRIHFFPDVGPEKMIIGYIGRHLRTVSDR